MTFPEVHCFVSLITKKVGSAKDGFVTSSLQALLLGHSYIRRPSPRQPFLNSELSELFLSITQH